MIKEPGVFSQRYLMRRGKENNNYLNVQHPQHTPEDFPLAYTSAKTHSRERPSISANRKREDKRVQQQQELEEKSELISKLQKELKQSREQTRRLAKEAQAKYSQYDKHIMELNEQLKEKEQKMAKIAIKAQAKRTGDEQGNTSRYKQTIKTQIYWLLGIFKLLHQDAKIDDLRREVSQAFMEFKDYISEFSIEKELQAIASTSHQANTNSTPILTTFAQPSNCNYGEGGGKNTDSIFTEDLQELNMIKLMELQPLIETFNNQQYCLAPQEEEAAENKMERVTKRLFSQSKFVGESQNCSLLEQDARKHLTSTDLAENQFLPKEESPRAEPKQPPKEQLELPIEVNIIKNFDPDARHDNYIKLRKGQSLRLLRKIRDQLWIGEVGQKIGLVSQEFFQL